MARKFTLTGAYVQRAMQSQGVRDALRAKADEVAASARSIAASENVEGFEVSVSEGTRPKGRPYARVSTPSVDQEFGTWRTPKLRILGRAAGHREPDPRERK